MSWNLDADKPIYIQLIEQIKLRILSGYYPMGEKIPAVRDMAKEAGVNPNTMQKALTNLEQDGLIYSKRTSGRFVSDDEKLLETLKKELANKKIKEFFVQMEGLGFSTDQTLELTQKFLRR